MSAEESAALEVLERINSRYVCPECHNDGGDGKHRQDCLLFSVLKTLRAKSRRW